MLNLISTKSKNKMKFFPFIVLFSLFTMKSYSQKVYSVDYENQADVKVYVVQYENQADLKVFKESYSNQATQNHGRWFFVNYSNQADKKIYFVKYEHKKMAHLNNSFFFYYSITFTFFKKVKLILFFLKK